MPYNYIELIQNIYLVVFSALIEALCNIFF